MEAISYTSEKKNGNMSFTRAQARGESPDDVIRAREAFLKEVSEKYGAEIPLDACVVMDATGDEIVEVSDEDKGRGARVGEESVRAQALIARRNVRGETPPLILLTADCLPITFYDKKTGILALAHCGWAESDREVARRVVEKMVEMGATPANIQVSIGPGIRSESYLVPSEKVSQKDDPRWEGFISEGADGCLSVDLVGFNIKMLKDAGIPIENISDSGGDTGEGDTYFSHHRAKEEEKGQTGRMMTVACAPPPIPIER